MSISDLANIPIELSLGGKIFKVQRLAMTEIFGYAEAKIVENYLKQVNTVAERLTGKLQEQYLDKATSFKSIPKGKELTEASHEYLDTIAGTMSILKLGLNKCQTVSDDELNSILLMATDVERNILIKYLTGSDAVEKAELTEGDKKK